jgi:hypothetical protein
MHSYKNKTGLVERCAKIESDSEKAFQDFVAKIGWSFCGFSSESVDINDHVDCYIKNPEGKKLSVDIKGFKHGVKCGRILVEILNVQGRRGWLLGKADYIAFAINETEFALIERPKLFTLIKNAMGLEVFTKGNFNVIMRKGIQSANKECLAPAWYCREDRQKERITNLPLEEVLKIKLAI